MKRIYAPGCAFVLYKPDLVQRLHIILNENLGEMDRLLTCCKNVPPLEPGTEVISTCPGCDKRYRTNYEDSSNMALWEILATSDFFPFPNYGGKKPHYLIDLLFKEETNPKTLEPDLWHKELDEYIADH